MRSVIFLHAVPVRAITRSLEAGNAVGAGIYGASTVQTSGREAAFPVADAVNVVTPQGCWSNGAMTFKRLHGLLSATVCTTMASAAMPPDPIGDGVDTRNEVKMIHGCRFEFDGMRWTCGGAEQAWAVSANQLTIRPRDGITDAEWRNALEQIAASTGAVDDLRIQEMRRNRLGFIDLELTGANATEVAFLGQDHPDLQSVFPAVTGRYFEFPGADPYYGQQWNLQETRSNGDGLAFNDIDAESGWRIESGDPSIVIAILDSGFMVQHSDLVDAFGFGVVEIGGNGIDDDENGFIDDVFGWNFATGDGDIEGGPLGVMHGTRISGLAAANRGNGVGIAGVAGGSFDQLGCGLLGLVVGLGGPDGSVVDDAILYAVDRGARVISMSFGIPPSPSVIAAIESAREVGVFMAAAVGNLLPQVIFPASHPDVMAVGGSDQADEAWWATTVGPEVEIVAPSVLLYTIDPYQDSWLVTGTSYATPQVAAAAALLMSWGDCLDGESVRAILRESATDIMSPGWDPESGWGRVDVGDALRQLVQSNRLACRCRTDLNGDGILDSGDLGVLLALWGTSDPLGDLDESGLVDGVDIGRFFLANQACD